MSTAGSGGSDDTGPSDDQPARPEDEDPAPEATTSQGESGDPPPATTAGPDQSDSSSDPGAPTIITLATDLPSLNENGELTFTAIVTDPDGIGDVIGGTLEAPSGNTYGVFATSADEGAYATTVRWMDVHLVEPIEFAPGADETRTFVARFFDQGGNEVSRSLDIPVNCEGLGACDGQCTAFGTGSNCAFCGDSCGTLECCNDACVDTRTDPAHCGGCGEACDPGVACEYYECGYEYAELDDYDEELLGDFEGSDPRPSLLPIPDLTPVPLDVRAWGL